MKQRLLDFVQSAHKKVQEFAVNVVLHRILIPFTMFVTYFVFFGLASVILRVFARSSFRPNYIEKGSYWIASEGNEPDLERAKRQS